MANDWIKMRMNLADDPAVIGIAARLKLDRFAVVGRLQHLWSWADEHSVDGFMPYVTAAVIDHKLDKKGFAEAMAAVDWLIIEKDGVRFPHFDRHNGESAKKRAMDMDRKRETRARETDRMRTGDAILSAKKADRSVTREEKRREEESSGGGPLDTTTPPPEASASEPPPPPRKFVDESDFPELERRFPLVDVRAELAGALRYRREKKGDVTGVELRFFAEDWLPRATPRTPAQQMVAEKKAAAAASDEPEGWQAWMDENYPGWIYATGQEPGAMAWAAHVELTKKFVRDSMKRGGAK